MRAQKRDVCACACRLLRRGESVVSYETRIWSYPRKLPRVIGPIPL